MEGNSWSLTKHTEQSFSRVVRTEMLITYLLEFCYDSVLVNMWCYDCPSCRAIVVHGATPCNNTQDLSETNEPCTKHVLDKLVCGPITVSDEETHHYSNVVRFLMSAFRHKF